LPVKSAFIGSDNKKIIKMKNFAQILKMMLLFIICIFSGVHDSKSQRTYEQGFSLTHEDSLKMNSFHYVSMILHDATAHPESSLVVEMELQKPDYEIITNFMLDVLLPEGFTYVAGSVTLNPQRKVDHIIQANVLPGTNIFRAISFSLSNSSYIGNEGIIMSFTLNAPTQTGTYPMNLQNCLWGNTVTVGPPDIIINGTVTITEEIQYLPGDANCNGNVNVMDVLSVINYIIGNNPQPFCFENADIFGNGVINASDVVGMVNLVLGRFVCGISDVSDIDGNTGGTVIIGNQCWMKENLKTTRYFNGSPIAYPGADSIAWQNNTTGAYAWNANDTTWKHSYGALYNWYAVANTNGLCPIGWRVPDASDWMQLKDYVASINNTNIGNQLKSCRQEDSPLGGDCNTSDHPRWNSHATHYGTDDYGFSMLPGGYRLADGSFQNPGINNYSWASTEETTSTAWALSLSYNAGLESFEQYDKRLGMSVRCVRNDKTPPTITTTEVTNITPAFAFSGGNVTFDGGKPVTARGVVWSLSQNPTIEANEGITNDGAGTGSFISYLFGLISATTYYLRSYAINIEGVAYGEELTFETLIDVGDGQPCPGIPNVSDIDGNVYNTVKIGNQCWMKENLNTTRDANGNSITRLCYENDTTNCSLYGGLYSWFTVMNGAPGSNNNPSGVQGICPTGWHVPSAAEWTQLYNYVIGINSVDVGNHLKSCRQQNSPLGGACNTEDHPRWDAHFFNFGTDNYGFSGLPGGFKPSGPFNNIGVSGTWWTSTGNGGSANYRVLIFASGWLVGGEISKNYGYSVRCVKN
jgi:uncharacterized protein (TIGR02145 family)